ncbi:uncharacterized protein BJ171DRAFT_514708 [Polychytrium aggregatum]|uniref:uncharacterized protein n=1 Tax=Polychytrium aggregatum TaxID=110093 RepID=UPI0022FE86BC|nr:uncharacterized protein BJ171DRAFT_514708 [Polychytrium aggregatum]KAI9202320.1 hypothetical protein BJ171DRAFT_514708 [Polychytrium aggregatum]
MAYPPARRTLVQLVIGSLLIIGLWAMRVWASLFFLLVGRYIIRNVLLNLQESVLLFHTRLKALSRAKIGPAATLQRPPVLPVEVLHLILEHSERPELYSSALVNRHWNQCASKVLYRHPRFRSIKEVEMLLRQLRQPDRSLYPYAEMIEELDFSQCSMFDKSQLGVHLFRELQLWLVRPLLSINFSGCSFIRDRHLGLLSRHLGSVQHIRISKCMVESADFTFAMPHEARWRSASRSMTPLSSPPPPSPPSLLPLAPPSSLLKTLHLNGCRNLSSLAFSKLSRNFPNLRSLDVSNTGIDHQSFTQFVDHSPLLRVLHFFNCENLDEGCIDYALAHLHWLCDMHFSAGLVSASLLESLEDEYPALWAVTIESKTQHEIRDVDLLLLLARFPALETLSLVKVKVGSRFWTDFTKVGGAALKRLSIVHHGLVPTVEPSAVPILPVSTVLSTNALDASGVTLSPSPDLLTAISRHCGKLEHFQVSFAASPLPMALPTFHGFFAALQHSGSRLVTVDLARSGIADVGLCELALAHGATIRVLDISDCWKVTDLSLEALAASCKGLQELYAFNCFQLTPTALHRMLKSCHLMKRLGVSTSTKAPIQRLWGRYASTLGPLPIPYIVLRQLETNRVYSLASLSLIAPFDLYMIQAQFPSVALTDVPRDKYTERVTRAYGTNLGGTSLWSRFDTAQGATGAANRDDSIGRLMAWPLLILQAARVNGWSLSETWTPSLDGKDIPAVSTELNQESRWLLSAVAKLNTLPWAPRPALDFVNYFVA